MPPCVRSPVLASCCMKISPRGTYSTMNARVALSCVIYGSRLEDLRDKSNLQVRFPLHTGETERRGRGYDIPSVKQEQIRY